MCLRGKGERRNVGHRVKLWAAPTKTAHGILFRGGSLMVFALQQMCKSQSPCASHVLLLADEAAGVKGRGRRWDGSATARGPSTV